MPARSRRQQLITIASAAIACSLAGAAAAQVALFSADNYGRAHLRLSETTADATAFIARAKGAFEPIGELTDDNPIHQLARPIGRVDILLVDAGGKTGMSTCTGALLVGDYVLTNRHCIPGDGRHRIVKASILMNYHHQDGAGSERFEIATVPKEADPELDYSVVRADGAPTRTYGFIRSAGRMAGLGESLVVIHHPLGQPKMMTRFRCFAAREQPVATYLRHRCDTQPGSSGSLLFDLGGMAVALHHSGGLSPNDETSANTGTQIRAMLDASRLLSSALVPGEPGKAVAGTGATTDALSWPGRPMMPGGPGPVRGSTATADEMRSILRSQ